jgi:hypothetical protein
MKLRYFVVDDKGRLRRARRARVEDLWSGRCGADALGCRDDAELRLVSVVCDKKLLPQKIYLLRVPLTAGRFTQENYLTLQVYTMPDCVTPQEVAAYHGGGWPGNLLPQLAVAADVPLRSLEVPVRIGGPLLLAAALHVSPTQALRYLR